MKTGFVLILLLLLSTTYHSDAIAGKIVSKVIKPIIRRIRQIGDKTIDGAAATIVIDKTSEQYDKWANKVSKTPSFTPKPKPTQPADQWQKRVKNTSKSSCPQNKKKSIQK